MSIFGNPNAMERIKSYMKGYTRNHLLLRIES